MAKMSMCVDIFADVCSGVPVPNQCLGHHSKQHRHFIVTIRRFFSRQTEIILFKFFLVRIVCLLFPFIVVAVVVYIVLNIFPFLFVLFFTVRFGLHCPGDYS